MTRWRLTPAARNDLSEIWDFTAERWDQHQAQIYVIELKAALERIAARPERGQACDEIRTGYRQYAIGSHLIFYVESEGGIVVVRILHQRMDPTRHV